MDLESEAMNLATQQHQSLARNLTDPESQDKIRSLEQQVAQLTQQLQGNSASTSALPLATQSGANSEQCRNNHTQHQHLTRSIISPFRTFQHETTTFIVPHTHQNTPSPGPPSSQDTSTQEVAPDTIMQPPIEGSSWLALNVPTKAND